MTPRSLFGLTVCMALALICRAQEPFHVDVHLIDVAFSVRDSQENLVTDLSQDDFDVFEDGVPQKISFFARSADIPLHLGLLVDFSGSQEGFVRAHHKDLEAFLNTALSPRDRAFLLCFRNPLHLVSDYSSSAKDILLSLQLYEGWIKTGSKNKDEFPRLGPPEIRPGCCNTSFYDAIYQSATEKFHGASPGRRAAIVFSDGDEHSSAHNMMDAIDAAQASDVVLFSVCYPDIHGSKITARNKYGIGVMKRIALETGGSYFDTRENGLANNFRRIGEQLRSSYELAYHTTNPAGDGSFHKISIRVKRTGLAARAKTGYYSR